MVVRTDAGVMVDSDQGEMALGDESPGVFADHLFVDGAIIDYAGQPVCPDFELLGDFHVVDDIESVDGAVIVTVEDRRAFVEQRTEGTATIPRRRFDCDRGQTTELVDPATGDELDRFGFSGRIIGLS